MDKGKLKMDNCQLSTANSQLKKGYKQTEVGVIPEDWEIKTFEDIAEITMGQSPIGTSYNQNGKGIALINGPTEFTVKHPMKIQWTSQPTKFCKEGDILICVRGSSTGRMNISNDVYCIGRGVAAIRAKPQHDNSFIEFQTYNAVKIILSLTSGSTFPNIDGKSLKSIKIPLPPTKAEQTAIATALSDADALISSLEKLIAKKRNIKKGAMQQLLTGKKRLPGFSGKWEVKKLGEICTPSKSRINPILVNESYKCVELEHLSQETGRLLDYVDSKNQLSLKALFQKRDVLFGKLRPYLKKFLFAEFEGVCSTEIWVLKSAPEIENKWLYYLIQLDKVLDAANQSTGTKMPRAEWNTVGNVSIPYPPVKAEQTAIAQILLDMDAEIEALEKKLEKYRMIKQGMMQDLLTGKIRLV